MSGGEKMSVDRLRKIPETDFTAQIEPYITPGRILRKASVELIKRSPDGLLNNNFFPTKEASKIVKDLKSSSGLQDQAWKIVFDHIFILRDKIFILANKKIHPDMWMRDFKFTSEFINSPELEENVLRTFENRQRPDGQIPTAIGVLGSTQWHYADDESTMLYITSVAQLVRRKENEWTRDREKKVASALGFIAEHVRDGMYVTPKGERRGWLDAFIYPQSDVITQNQGIYAVCLHSAKKLGFKINDREIETASLLYQTMADFNGYLPLSARFNEAPDISSLYPEYLAMTMFDRQLLSDKVVSDTLASVPKSNHGFKVLTKSPKGDYFDSSFFVTGYKEGIYQNGGSWPLWNNIALVVGELHGVVKLQEYREKIIEQLNETGWPEYIRTGEEYEEIRFSERPGQVWNVAIPAQHKIADKILAR